MFKFLFLGQYRGPITFCQLISILLQGNQNINCIWPEGGKSRLIIHDCKLLPCSFLVGIYLIKNNRDRISVYKSETDGTRLYNNGES